MKTRKLINLNGFSKKKMDRMPNNSSQNHQMEDQIQKVISCSSKG
jgi:hypothetical protein